MTRPGLFALLMTLSPWFVLPQAVLAAESEAVPHPDVARIEPQDLKRLIDEKTAVIIVDTRDSLSYETSHIPGAINIYYDPNGDPSTREMMLVALPMDKLVVLYCPWTDDEESASLALEMRQLGYSLDKLRALRGGSIAWEELALPMVDGTGNRVE